MSDHSNMSEQARQAAESRDRARDPGEKKMLDSQHAFYAAMAASEKTSKTAPVVQTKK